MAKRVISVRISEDMYDRLQAISKMEGRTATQTVRWATQRYLNESIQKIHRQAMTQHPTHTRDLRGTHD